MNPSENDEIWIVHPESESVFKGKRSELERDGLLVEITEEEAKRLLAKERDKNDEAR